MNHPATGHQPARPLELSLAAGVESGPALTSADRLSFTFCLALLFHALIVLGIVFAPQDKTGPRYEYMDVTLVQESSDAPEQADALAQANLRGGGETFAQATPAVPTPPVPPAEQPQAMQPTGAPARDPAPVADTRARQPEPTAAAVKQLAVDAEQPKTAALERPAAAAAKRPSASELVTDSLRMAALDPDVEKNMETSSNNLKRTFISASTHEYKYAAYMKAWRAKVERVGNLNYPEEARRHKISGQLVLDVAVNPDGKINQITIRRSSGHKVLDDAAIRIVELAAPFAPFPDAIRAETDVLHINRTWQFIDQSGFR